MPKPRKQRAKGKKGEGEKGKGTATGGEDSRRRAQRVHYVTAVLTHVGQRPSMEDEWSVEHCNDLIVPAEHEGSTAQMYCAVFDGHAGKSAARYAKENLFPTFAASLQSAVGRGTMRANAMQSTLKNCVSESFEEVDRGFSAVERESFHKTSPSGKKYSGSTALALFFDGDRLTCANAGDCRAILVEGNSATALTKDHRVDNEVEAERILAAWVLTRQGGWIKDSRLCGIMETVRGFGDVDFKEMKGEMFPEHSHKFTADLMIPTPEVTHSVLPLLSLKSKDGVIPYVVLASDGLWDLMSNDEVAEALYHPMQECVFPRLKQLADSPASPRMVDEGPLQAVVESFLAVIRQKADESDEYMDNLTAVIVLPIPCLDQEHFLDPSNSCCVYCFSTEEQKGTPTFESHITSKLLNKASSRRTARKRKSGQGKKGKGKKKR